MKQKQQIIRFVVTAALMCVLLALIGLGSFGTLDVNADNAAISKSSHKDRDDRMILDAAHDQNFTTLYDFESDLEGWKTASGGIKDVQWSAEQAFSNTHSLKLVLDLHDEEHFRSGEISVDFANARTDLVGQTLVAWVYGQSGARGNGNSPSGIHLFVEDKAGKRLYGTWRNMLENGWFQLVLPVTATLPACGRLDPGFDPSSISKLGINITAGTDGGTAIAYTGAIFVDAIAYGMPKTLATDHLYNFADTGAQTRIPRWGIDPTWAAQAWNELHVENGALVANAIFDTKTDSTRKGFTRIVYSPYLNLGHKDHHIISFDIRFEPSAVASPPAHCPFVISLWVWDDYKQKWFSSDNQHVGLGDWTTVSFDLDNPAELAPGTQAYQRDMPTLTDIRQVGIQVYANSPYTGTVMFDNIVVGGKEIADQYINRNQGFVKAQGTQFVLQGKPFRFVSFNIEYLFLLREREVAGLLDAIARLPEPRVIRVWGFSEGCEGNHNCVDYSRFFQPKRGVWNETAFENLDRLLLMATERGIRIIFPLANNWDEYGGAPQYVAWLAEEHPDQITIPPSIKLGTEVYTHTVHDLFFTNAYTRQWYKDYVTTFINRTNHISGIRYADDPTIFSFELINEPRTKSDVSGATIHNWLVEMSAFVNSLAPNHLIGTGEEGWYIMPYADTQKFAQWQSFPKNYWHYGVNWLPEYQAAPNWGSNGSDFISDHASITTTVRWQESVGSGGATPIQAAQRAGLPYIDYTSLHLYIDLNETNLYQAPYCAWGFTGYLCDEHNADVFQAGEWIKQHVQDSHTVLGKPIIVAEFGLRQPETYQNFFALCQPYVPAFMPEERKQLYSRYLQTMCQADLNGTLVWNLGYDRFNDLLWDGVESLQPWKILTGSDAVSISLNIDPAFVSWRNQSIQVNYDPALGYGRAIVERINIHQDWLTENPNKTRVEFDLFNPENITMTVAISLVTASGSYESIATVLNRGWNKVEANAFLPYWNCSIMGCQVVKGMDNVKQVNIILSGYKQPGRIYIDYIRHQSDDSLAIYPDEPIFETIQTEAQQWLQNTEPLCSVTGNLIGFRRNDLVLNSQPRHICRSTYLPVISR